MSLFSSLLSFLPISLSLAHSLAGHRTACLTPNRQEIKSHIYVSRMWN